jgi:hypothetical protein
VNPLAGNFSENSCMKILLALLALTFSLCVFAQPRPPMPLPKHIILKPTANPKLITFADVIIAKWHGARLTDIPGGGVTVDSLWFEFKKDGTLSFKHQKYEFNGPTMGTWTMTGNAIRINADKFPFTHNLSGTWNINNGVISGTFTELRERDNTQPPYYSPGSNTGTFNLSRY